MGALLIVQCTTLNSGSEISSKRQIERPFDNVDIAFIESEINAQEGDIILFESGTRIHVPANSFVDGSGKDVQGMVEITYREFASAADILISGIPMKYDSAGVTQEFQSAGMMEIRAYQGNEELALKEGKEITVEMATEAEDRDYKSYYFDNEEGEWVYKSTDIVMDNSYREDLLKKLDLEEPESPVYKPSAYDPDAYTFDLNINYKRFPELRDLNGVMWQYASNAEENNPESIKLLKETQWTKVSITRVKDNDGVFKLKLTDGKAKYSTVILPVLRGRSLEKATEKFNESFAAYEESKLRIQQEKERIKQQAKLLRVFSVSQMGIYNYDRQLKFEDRVELAARFDFGKDANLDFNKIHIFLVCGNDQSVVKYPKEQWELFAFSPSESNKLVAVMPGDKVAVMSSSEFRELDLTKFSKGKRTPHTFKLKSIEGTMASKEDLSQLLNSL